jgi:hypothetical protein
LLLAAVGIVWLLTVRVVLAVAALRVVVLHKATKLV